MTGQYYLQDHPAGVSLFDGQQSYGALIPYEAIPDEINRLVKLLDVERRLRRRGGTVKINVPKSSLTLTFHIADLPDIIGRLATVLARGRGEDSAGG